MHNKYVIITYIEHYGGIETLVLRMLRWMKQNNKECIVIIDADREADPEIMKKIQDTSDSIIKIPFRSYCKKELIKQIPIKSKDKTEIISFTYPEYFLAQEIKSYYSNFKIDLMFYVPHQYGLIMEFNFNKPILKKIGKRIGKHMTIKMNQNHEIVHMDYLCSQRLETEYGIKQTKETDFKGYVFGLMDMFDKLAMEDDNVKLVLIGDGPDFGKLKEEREKHKYKDRIVLTGAVPYDDLQSYFETAFIYIGMGTTLLDAANASVVGFPVGSYTYECKGYDHYYKDGMNLGGLHGENDITPLISECIHLSKDQYIAIAEKQHDEIVKCYEINHIMKRIDSFSNKHNARSFSSFDMLVIKLIKVLYSFRRLIK